MHNVKTFAVYFDYLNLLINIAILGDIVQLLYRLKILTSFKGIQTVFVALALLVDDRCASQGIYVPPFFPLSFERLQQ